MGLRPGIEERHRKVAKNHSGFIETIGLQFGPSILAEQGQKCIALYYRLKVKVVITGLNIN